MSIFKKLTKYPPKSIFIFTLVVLVLLIMFSIIFAYNLEIRENQQFVYLADSFLKGRLDFQEKHLEHLTVRANDYAVIWTDTSEWQGKKYWPLGPFPAVALMPFVSLFSAKFLQGYISFVLTLVSFYLLYRIARQLNVNKTGAVWLACFFIFSSAFLGVAVFSVSWYFAQVTAVALLLLALNEFFGKKRWRLIGFYIAAAALTRSHLILAALFFVIMILSEKISRDKKIKNLFQFGFLILGSLFLIFLYNYARFENPFEGGYALQDIPPVLAEARKAGLFSLKHIPGNLFFMLFRGPDPVLAEPTNYVLKYPYITANVWGMGIFFTSPVLLYIFSAPWRDKIVRTAALTSLLILIPIIAYYGIGVSQLGYRYALDFMPFLYLILCKALAPKLLLKAKILIVVGILLNWHLLFNFRS